VQAAIFDLDQTLVDSSAVAAMRSARNWRSVLNSLHLVQVYPHIQTYLETLTSIGIPYAVVTNAPSMYCDAVIQLQGWKPAAVVAWHTTTQHKPHPEPVLKALAGMGLHASPAIYGFGDDPNDIIAYSKAGITPIGCLWGVSEPLLLQQAVAAAGGRLAHTLSTERLIDSVKVK
jgi:beta-phosphoglucomutase-like phosphatase (HAD superfamily)